MAKKKTVKTPSKVKKGVNPNSLKNLRPAKKGEVRNPAGFHSQDPVTRALRQVTKETLNELIELALTSNMAELNRIYQDSNTPALKKILCGVIYDACKDKTLSSVERLLERLIGKVPQDITSGGKPLPAGGAPSAVIIVPANGKTKEENEK